MRYFKNILLLFYWKHISAVLNTSEIQKKKTDPFILFHVTFLISKLPKNFHTFRHQNTFRMITILHNGLISTVFYFFFYAVNTWEIASFRYILQLVQGWMFICLCIWQSTKNRPNTEDTQVNSPEKIGFSFHK